MRRIVFALVVLVVWLPSPTVVAALLVPPVDGIATRRFEAPSSAWGPGHRGIDYDVAEGTLVRAAAAGTVVFAGSVGDARAVTIAHSGGLETTYSSLGGITVATGELVDEGTWIGRAGGAHGSTPGLHFGVKIHDAYVDPDDYFAPVAVGDAIRLAPLVWQPPATMPQEFSSAFRDPGTHAPLCREGVALGGVPPVAPNENVAVAIAGIGSRTKDGVRADMYEHGPEELGYAPRLIYPFSYRGSRAEGLHVPYEPRHTFGDINQAADRLARLLRKIGRDHPGRHVDLIAHSMGGLVARRFLTSAAKEHRRHLPRVEHLVTFSAPHQGAALATVGERLEEETLTGRFLVDGLSYWSDHGGPVPDPRSTAVSQMQPDSAFLRDLARESVVSGTRSLALAIPNDVVVTADRAGWEESTTRVVAPSGLSGHSAIVSSDAAQGLAYAFLRGAAPSCETGWDLWGPRLGRAVGFVEEQSYRGLAAVEQVYLRRWLKLGTAAKKVGGRLGWVAERAAGKLVHRIAVDRL